MKNTCIKKLLYLTLFTAAFAAENVYAVLEGSSEAKSADEDSAGVKLTRAIVMGNDALVNHWINSGVVPSLLDIKIAKESLLLTNESGCPDFEKEIGCRRRILEILKLEFYKR